MKLGQPTYYSETCAFRFTLQPYDGTLLRTIIC